MGKGWKGYPKTSVVGKVLALTNPARIASYDAVADEIRSYTLKRKCMTSPSCTT
jgi:hypothetical protein